MLQLTLNMPAKMSNPSCLHTAIKLRVLHTGLVGRLSSGKYFAFHAVAAGLSDRDGRDTLYVVSILHLGLENTLVRPARCSYGHQNRHQKTKCGCCCCCCFFFKFLIGWKWFILGEFGYKAISRGIGVYLSWVVGPLVGPEWQYVRPWNTTKLPNM